LRTFERVGHYNACDTLSEATRPLYEAVRNVVGVAPDPHHPYIWNDADQALDEHIAALVEDMQGADGKINSAVRPTLSSLLTHRS
jgi:phenylalanine ammonia-lyase